jgi:hypothetical protein
MNGEDLFNLDDTWVDEADVEGELDGLLGEIEDERFLDEIGELGEDAIDVGGDIRLPVQPEPGVGAAAEAVGVAALAVLMIEIVSISNAVGFLNEKDKIQDKIDSLSGIRDLAFKNHQWNDQLQSAWTKAMDGLARKAEDLQHSLKNTIIGKLIFWD